MDSPRNELVLTVQHPGHSETSLRLDRATTIGRNPRRCQVVWDHEKISRVHATATPSREGWALQDAGSENGTFINGIRLLPLHAECLNGGDRVVIGPVVVKVVECPHDEDPGTKTHRDGPAISELRVHQAGSVCSLSFVCGSGLTTISVTTGGHPALIPAILRLTGPPPAFSRLSIDDASKVLSDSEAEVKHHYARIQDRHHRRANLLNERWIKAVAAWKTVGNGSLPDELTMLEKGIVRFSRSLGYLCLWNPAAFGRVTEII